jgi:CDP-diacylglycerol--serine O-phosphatidyltransferase
MDRPRPRRFSMIRDFQLADFFTLGNGFAGTGAILATLKFVRTGDTSALTAVFILLPIALILDFLDGRIARWRRKVSMLGQELDSLADLVSFGVAPAVLGFGLGLDGGWDAAVMLYFVGCGISRLARYNTTATSLADDSGKVKYYEGTPIPTSLAIVALLGVLVARGAFASGVPLGAVTLGPAVLHPLVLVYFLSGSAMVSKTLRIPKP